MCRSIFLFASGHGGVDVCTTVVGKHTALPGEVGSRVCGLRFRQTRITLRGGQEVCSVFDVRTEVKHATVMQPQTELEYL